MPRPAVDEQRHLDMESLLAKQTAEIKLHAELQMDTLRRCLECHCAKVNELQFLPDGLASPSQRILHPSSSKATMSDSSVLETRQSSRDDDCEGAPGEGTEETELQNDQLTGMAQTIQRGVSTVGVRGEKYILEGGLDFTMGILVLLNAFVLVIRGQALGAQANASLGLSSDEGAREVADICEVLEQVFVVLYLIEMLARIYALRKWWLCDETTGGLNYVNLFDTLIVVAGISDAFLVPWFTDGKTIPNVTTLRLVRMLRLPRTFRVFRMLALFRQLRIIAMTFIASVRALFWSMVVLGICMFIGSMILTHTLHGDIINEDIDLETRLWVNSMYGSAAKSMYTMFEVTNSGGWPGYARPLIEKVNPWYALFYCVYVTFVIFATIKIIAALFIKETLNAASSDASLAMQEHLPLKEAYTKQLQKLFEATDTSGNGTITFEEFEHALKSDVVRQHLRFLEIEVHDIQALFSLLDDGDGEITITEFCQGIMRLKGQARTLDVISIMHDAHTIMAQCSEIKELVVNLRRPQVSAQGAT